MQSQKCGEAPVIAQPALGVRRGFIKPLGTTGAYPKKFVAGPTEIITFPTDELPSLSNGVVEVIATSDTCEAITAPGACRQGCCPSGFQCAFQNKLPQAWRKKDTGTKKIIGGIEIPNPFSQQFLGVCVPTKWQADQVCLDPMDPECRILVEAIVNATSAWQLIITSGGGGGHYSAAMNLGAQAKKKWTAAMQATEVQLNGGAPLLTKFGQKALAQSLRGTLQKPPIEVLDIMHSPCTNVLGALGVPFGSHMTAIWDHAQQQGQIGRLNLMLKQEGAVDTMFYGQCLQYMQHVLQGDLGFDHAPYFGPPSHLISTEPMLLPSISEAVEEVMKEGSTLSKVHLYMTDLPGEDNKLPFSFWSGIERMQQMHAERAQRLVLHTVAPISGGAAAIAQTCGLDVSQVVIERFLPVNAAFYEGGFPRPGTATEIHLTAQLPQEQGFLGGPKKSFIIAAHDVVTLVMLGSQPTVKAMHTYLEQAALLKQPPPGIKRWIFLASGPHQKPAFADLYVNLSARATELNGQQEKSGGGLRFIPFTGQPAQAIEGRAEVTVTRSGGMTAGELLALAARGDQKQVLLHIEKAAGVPLPPTAVDIRSKSEWDEQALNSGMVEWEAGNARYLMNKIGAKLVTPETFAQTVEYPTG